MDVRKSRGRPPKFAQTVETERDSSYDLSEPNTSKDKPRQKKNREVANLINMDFGPGKNPFEVGFFAFRPILVLSFRNLNGILDYFCRKLAFSLLYYF